MHRFHQHGHVLGRGVLADAVAQVEDVGGAGGGAVGVWLAKAIQHGVHLGDDLCGRRKQHVGVDVAKVPKYYLSTKNDKAVPYALQQQMIRENGTVRKVYELETSHLPFVVRPEEFVNIIRGIQ